jgi:hypothetical protein
MATEKNYHGPTGNPISAHFAELHAKLFPLASAAEFTHP